MLGVGSANVFWTFRRQNLGSSYQNAHRNLSPDCTAPCPQIAPRLHSVIEPPGILMATLSIALYLMFWIIHVYLSSYYFLNI